MEKSELKKEGKRETVEDEVMEGHSAKFLKSAAKRVAAKHSGKKHAGKRSSHK